MPSTLAAFHLLPTGPRASGPHFMSPAHIIGVIIAYSLQTILTKGFILNIFSLLLSGAGYTSRGRALCYKGLDPPAWWVDPAGRMYLQFG